MKKFLVLFLVLWISLAIIPSEGSQIQPAGLSIGDWAAFNTGITATFNQLSTLNESEVFKVKYLDDGFGTYYWARSQLGIS